MYVFVHFSEKIRRPTKIGEDLPTSTRASGALIVREMYSYLTGIILIFNLRQGFLSTMNYYNMLFQDETVCFKNVCDPIPLAARIF